MKQSIEFIEQLDSRDIRKVFHGHTKREDFKKLAEEQGFSKSAGQRAHRLIRAHENIDAFIAFYVDGIAHAMEAAEAPEIDGNVANVTVKYPHGRPVRGIDELFIDHEEDPEEWEIESVEVNEWPTTMSSDDDGVIYVNNYQAKARMTKKEREPQFERVKPVKVDTPEKPDVETLDKARPEGWKTALILMDRQVGHRRSPQDSGFQTIHDRQAIDLAVKIAALSKPEILIDIGDILDFAGISSFVESPDFQRALQPSLCETAYDNARFLSAAEPEDFHIIQGNHDKRIGKKLIEDAQEMYQLKDVEAQAENGPPAMSVPALLNFDEHGITWHDGYPDNELLLNEGLSIRHGDTTKSDSGGTVQYMLKYDSTDYSQIVGHIHRHELAWRTIWKGRERREICAASGGCLCRVDGGVPGYKDRQNWQQGLIEVHYDPNGWEHIVNPIRIWPESTKEDNSVCWYRGKKLIADPPSPKTLSEKTGFNFT